MALEKILENTFKGETTEVGWYLAMSKIAEREGFADIAVYLRQIAMDEAWHATEVAEILGLVKETTLENLEMMFEGESKAEVEKAEAAELPGKREIQKLPFSLRGHPLTKPDTKQGLTDFWKD